MSMELKELYRIINDIFHINGIPAIPKETFAKVVAQIIKDDKYI